jgi:MYXO-CTERM domain-containing protein
VSLGDFTLLRNAFGDSIFGSDAGDLSSSFALMDAWAASVPEPGVLSLAGVAGLVGLRRRRQ